MRPEMSGDVLKGQYIYVVVVRRFYLRYNKANIISNNHTNMSTDLYNNIYEFLTTAEEHQINATSVIYLGMKEDRWIPQNELRSIIDRVVASASNVYMDTSSRQLRILRILPQVSYLDELYSKIIYVI